MSSANITEHIAPESIQVAIIGGGPAGLMAAETLAAVDGMAITVFDAMPSVGRKFLMAGKGGMNITHAEPYERFTSRYGARQTEVRQLLDRFPPEALRQWIHGLGIDTFVGTSGRVFPTEMKAAPLLRAWLHRLRNAGVHFAVRHRWLGWTADGKLRFRTPSGETHVTPDATLLALGGASWAKLGSDGRWVELLEDLGIAIAPLKPANCGFDVVWSEHFRSRFAGAAVKTVMGCCGQQCQQGEFNITESGIEGGLIYALSANLRDELAEHGKSKLLLDLLPGRTLERIQAELARPRGRDSLANHLRRRLDLEGVKAGLLRECLSSETLNDSHALAATIKEFPITVTAPRPMDEAISTAGGVPFEVMDPQLMLNQMPGVFCAGEMLDWEAPTGGYLLSACFASGRVAGEGVAAWLRRGSSNRVSRLQESITPD